ncbi:zinc carboxypeptidase-like [Schistocerca cancellata]|uniref:zinc carboxypeptidase-like n=1 Tax=Schistocerca cancellata TaxID=274614 RepID=UPI00211849CD|nr:zinc carboxypeptidase-like [Schistocerca cancellata]
MAAVSYCLAVLLIVARGAAGGERARFDHYQVFRLTPSSATQLHLLNALNARPDGMVASHLTSRCCAQLEFLSEPSAVARSVDVMVAPHQHPSFRDLLTTSGIGYTVTIPDVQRLLEDGESSGKNSTDYDWETYQDLPQLNAWIDATVARHPEAASILVAGTSFEGRPLKGVRICHGPGRPVVFVEAGIDGAEWPSVSTATFLVHQLLTNDSEAVRRVVQAFDWHVLPTANPDGCNYAHTTDRIWRKNRRPGPNGCYGTDPNRNWDFNWGDSGSSDNPCSPHYRGSSPFSEPETRSLSDFLRGLKERLLVYVSLHTYKQALMWPYGLSYERADNNQELMEVANISAEALSRRYGTKYQTGTIFDIFGGVSGSSVDWVKKSLGARFVFEYDLRDTGGFGLLLPPAQVRPTAEETADSLVAMMREVLARTATPH